METQRMNTRSDELQTSTMTCVGCGQVYQSNVMSAWCEDCTSKKIGTTGPSPADVANAVGRFQKELDANAEGIAEILDGVEYRCRDWRTCEATECPSFAPHSHTGDNAKREQYCETHHVVIMCEQVAK